MNTSEQTLFAVEPKAQWLVEKIASFFRLVLELHLMILKAWGHFFLMFTGVVLSFIAVTELNQSQTVLTSVIQIAVGATLIFSKRTRELMWVCALLTVAWFIPITLFGMIIFGEGFEVTEPSLLLKGTMALLYLAPPFYGTYLIYIHRRRKLIQSR
ncbi:MAG: hypothetical protein AAGH40_08150 [Verrucomicrobiota bacterium]